MEKSCLQMAYPGKIGFLILGIFFVLAFASWNVVRQPAVENDEVVLSEVEHDVHVYIENSEELELQNFIKFGDRVLASTTNDSDEAGEETSLDKDVPKRIPTFLSSLKHSFVNMQVTADYMISTEDWLDCCTAPKHLLSSVGSTMDKVWGDVGTNLNILRDRYESNPQKFVNLQAIVIDEIEQGVARHDGSASMAILWLKRSFEFVVKFFENLEKGQDPSSASSKAYEVTLAKRHNFVLRAVFYTAMKTLGSRSDFYSQMALSEEDFKNPSFEQTATQDLKLYTDALERILRILDEFLKSQGLDE